MYKLIVAFFISPFFISCSSNEPTGSTVDPGSPQKVIIAGKVSGGDWQDLLLQRVTDFNQYEYDTISIDSTETFKFEFTAHWPHSFNLWVGSNTSRNQFYATYMPGDSVFLVLDQKRDHQSFLSALKIDGVNVGHYDYARRTELSSYELTDNPEIVEIESKGKPDYMTFLRLADLKYEDRMQRFRKDTVGLDLTEEFISYETKRLYYQHLERKAGEPLLRLYLSFDSTEVPRNYYGFMDSVEIYDAAAYNIEYYYRYLDDYTNPNEYKSPKYPIIDRILWFTDKRFALADTALMGKAKEYYKSRAIQTYIRLDLYVADSLHQLLSSQGYDNFMLREYRRAIDSLRSQEFYIPVEFKLKDLDGKEKRLLDRTYDYSYIGLWDTGCKGCVMDFMNKPEVSKRYRNSNINLVNVALQQDTARITDWLDKYGDSGVNLYDHADSLSDLLKVSSRPRYLLVNNRGKVLKDYFYRPGDPNLIKELDKIVEYD